MIFIGKSGSCSVAKSCLTLWPHGLQHDRLPCPSWTSGAYSNSCPSSRWCHPTISSFVVPFSSCLQSFPASVSFQWVSFSHQFSSVQLLSRVWLFATPWTAAHQASLSITNSQSPPKPMSIVLVIPFNHLIPYHPLLLLPSIFPIIRGVFSNESALRIRWPKYWSFSFSISPSNEYSGLVSFRIDWLDLLAVQGTLKSLFQHQGSKASILHCSAFIKIQLSHPYITTEKTIASARQNFVTKVIFLLF